MRWGLFVLVLSFLPAVASAQVVINEIAWMGTKTSATDEWIELYNPGAADVALDDWALEAQDGQPSITLSGAIPGGSYFLLERTDDETVQSIAADFIYTGALSNSGEKLELSNAAGTIVDRVDATAGWPAGDNITKETMQRLNAGGWITASGTPASSNKGEPRSENANTGNIVEINGNTGENNASGASMPVYEPKKSFTVDAGDDAATVAGAEVRFFGAAYGFDGKPLDSSTDSGQARYLWNFGDGTFFEAKNTNHIYRYPGIYRAALYVSSGQTSGSDTVEVAVGESSVVISEMASAWIELANEGARAVDLSSWQIRSDLVSYTIPAHTTISPRAFIVFPRETTSILFGPLNPKAELRYANGTLADTLSFAGTLLPEKSVMRDEEKNMVMREQTPGKENIPSVIASSVATRRGNPVENSEIASSATPPRNDDQRDNQALISETITTPNLPLYKGRSGGVTDSNYFWLAISISVGLVAGAVVLVLRSMVL